MSSVSANGEWLSLGESSVITRHADTYSQTPQARTFSLQQSLRDLDARGIDAHLLTMPLWRSYWLIFLIGCGAGIMGHFIQLGQV